MFLIDTDVLSALRRRERHPEAVGWLEAPADGRPVSERSDHWRN